MVEETIQAEINKKDHVFVYHQFCKKKNQHIHRRCNNQLNIHIVNLMIPRLIDEMTYTNFM